MGFDNGQRSQVKTHYLCDGVRLLTTTFAELSSPAKAMYKLLDKPKSYCCAEDNSWNKLQAQAFK